MQLIDKANVLSQLWMLDRQHDVSVFADLGMPYSFGIANGDILELSAEGEEMIESAWQYFCNYFSLNPTDDLANISVEELMEETR